MTNPRRRDGMGLGGGGDPGGGSPLPTLLPAALAGSLFALALGMARAAGWSGGWHHWPPARRWSPSSPTGWSASGCRR